MRSALLHLVNHLSALLPQTRMFALRASLLRAGGVTVAPGARINGGVWFQHANVDVGAGTWIGRRTEFAPGVTAKISIGARCDVSQDVLFVCGTHDVSGPERRAGEGHAAPISVGAGTWVGARATFLGGAVVGSGSIVAAGSLVRGTFPANVLLAGTPARILRHLDADDV